MGIDELVCERYAGDFHTVRVWSKCRTQGPASASDQMQGGGTEVEECSLPSSRTDDTAASPEGSAVRASRTKIACMHADGWNRPAPPPINKTRALKINEKVLEEFRPALHALRTAL
jgi:hypothetical protein